MAKNQRFLIKWREQGQPVIDAIIFAESEKDALIKLRDRLLTDCGIGYHYLWVMRVRNETTDENHLYIKRINDVIETL